MSSWDDAESASFSFMQHLILFPCSEQNLSYLEGYSNAHNLKMDLRTPTYHAKYLQDLTIEGKVVLHPSYLDSSKL